MDELAGDSDDKKKISKAEKAAKQKSQKRKKEATSGKKTGFRLQAQSPRSEWWKTRVGPPMAVSLSTVSTSAMAWRKIVHS